MNTISRMLSPTISDDENSYGQDQSYYTPEAFNEYVSHNKLTTSYNNLFSMIHFNCRSILKNFDDIIALINFLSIKFTVIGVSETWLKDNSIQCNILGYNFLSNNRKNRRGGGVGIYIKDDLVFKCRNDVEINDVYIESIFVEIEIPQSKNVILGVIYRPPDQSVPLFLDALSNIFHYVSKENKILYFLGDFNIDLLTVSSSPQVNNFLDIFMTNSSYPLIHYPTRVSPNSATLIDNIFTNNLTQLSSGVILDDISDHLPVFCICHNLFFKGKQHDFLKRVINEVSISKFYRCLEQISWNLDEKDPNLAYNSFLNEFLEIYNKCFPLQKVIIKKKFSTKPWIDKDLIKKIKKNGNFTENTLRIQLIIGKKFIRNVGTWSLMK